MITLWDWKWRFLAIGLLIYTFISNYPQGIWNAMLSALTLYAFLTLGQLVFLEIEWEHKIRQEK